MGASRNQESTRQEKDGVVYYDRGILTGKDGRRYQRYAIKTHFVQPGEDQAELVRRYVLPLYQPGDCLSFTAKVMGMCTNNVRTLADTFHMAISAEPASALTLYGPPRRSSIYNIAKIHMERGDYAADSEEGIFLNRIIDYVENGQG